MREPLGHARKSFLPESLVVPLALSLSCWTIRNQKQQQGLMNSPLVDQEPIVTSFVVQHDVNRTSILEKGIEKESSESSLPSSQRYILQIESDHEQNDNNNSKCYLPPTSIDASGCLPPVGDLVDNTNDDDDPEPATNYVFEYLKYYKEDLFWSFLSDVCFLMGIVLYLSLSYFEVQGGRATRFYYILDILAPLLYLLNSAVDIQWALLVQRRPKRLPAEMMTGLWRNNTGLPPPLTSPSFTSSQTSNNSNSGPAADQQQPPPDHYPTSSTPLVITSSSSSWWQRLFRHAAHRRTLYAAGSFGLAALLSVIAVLLEYETASSQEKEASTSSSSNEEQGRGTDILDALSDHVYVISAVIALTGRRVRPWFYTGGHGGNTQICAIFHEPEALEDMGDILFLIGSLFDAMLDDLAMQTIPLLGAVSSLLWFVDALLYLRSDFVMSRRLGNSDLSAQLV
jgi:hypothetical protein